MTTGAGGAQQGSGGTEPDSGSVQPDSASVGPDFGSERPGSGAPSGLPWAPPRAAAWASPRQPVRTDHPQQPRRKLPYTGVITGVVALVVTGTLAWATATVFNNNEQRLLRQQVKLAATTVTQMSSTIQISLTGAYDVATVTNDRLGPFKHVVKPDVGRGREFVSVSLWDLSSSPPRALAVVGAQPDLTHTRQAGVFLSRIHPSSHLQVTSIIRRRGHLALGYAEIPPGSSGAIAVYAETRLRHDRRFLVPRRSVFSDLDFAVYLGRATKPGTLLATSTSAPLSGSLARTTVPFGDTVLTFVATSTQPLSGEPSQALPWVVVGVGILLAGTAVFITERLVRRRRAAEGLAAVNRQLYSEQRNISETLQRALLPADLPSVRGLEIAVRYLPGVTGVEVGGDWYDVIRLSDSRCALVVGDVSGRGLPAANTMASLHYAIRAYVAEDDDPETVLAKLRALVKNGDGRFATVLYATVDVDRQRLTLASAGHFAPLLVDENGARFVDVPISPPVGVPSGDRPASQTIGVGNRATVIAFTDGLVERRDEIIDLGMNRLRSAVLRASDGGQSRTMDDVLNEVLMELTPSGSEDDIAILGVRWQS